MTTENKIPPFALTQESRVYGPCDNHWRSIRITWDESTDTFLVETTQDDPCPEDPFDTKQDWHVEKANEVAHWMGLCLNAIYDDYMHLAVSVTSSKLFILGTMFMKNTMIYDDFMLSVLRDNTMVDYDAIAKSFVEYQAKNKDLR
jgi:hypothetical protein|tara:strand:+ start:1102 stop:1536 length:435 start_codon:yes stop_codon:yes gene_type:complete